MLTTYGEEVCIEHCSVVIASFPGSSPAFCCTLNKMQQKAGGGAGGEAWEGGYSGHTYSTICCI